jgi:hypothetical protein
MSKREQMHVYQTDGSSRDPSCKVCGSSSWDNRVCFESVSAMRMKKEIIRLRKRGAKP